jgi:hypothetical protein
MNQRSRRLRGANTPEQRSSTESSIDLEKKGGMPMEIKNNTAAPQFKINWKHLSLVVLHFVVFVLSTISQEFITTEGAARALP